MPDTILAPRRPVYETSENLSREQRAAHRHASNSNRDYVKLPKFYAVDYALKEKGGQRVTSWLEIKCRNVSRNQYPTLILSVKKVMAGLQLAETTGLPFVLFVEWNDYAGWYLFNPDTKLHVIVGGREDRNDPQDIEPVFEIPIKNFNCKPLADYKKYDTVPSK